VSFVRAPFNAPKENQSFQQGEIGTACGQKWVVEGHRESNCKAEELVQNALEERSSKGGGGGGKITVNVR
jgi:hypothetical protein